MLRLKGFYLAEVRLEDCERWAARVSYFSDPSCSGYGYEIPFGFSVSFSSLGLKDPC